MSHWSLAEPGQRSRAPGRVGGPVPVGDTSTVAGRSRWLDEQVDELLARLSGFGLTVAAEQARALITERIEVTAVAMRISPQSERRHLDLAKLSESLAASLAEEQPGADLMEVERTTALSMPLLGRASPGWPRPSTFGCLTRRPARRRTTSRRWPRRCRY